MSSSAERFHPRYFPAVTERRSIAMSRDVAPPLHRNAGRSAAAATFVRPPRASLAAVPAPASCGTAGPLEQASPAAAAVPCARGAGLPTVSAVPVLSLDCEAERGCAGVAPATVAATVAPAVHVAAPVCGTRRLSAMPAAALVEAFRATCEGHVADVACTPQGKALLQAALRTQRPEVLDSVVTELCPRLRDVAVDVHGCHVLRTLVEACTAEQTEALIGAMHASVVLNMCTASQYTRRTLQSLFERREVDLSALVHVLADNAGYLAATQQGCISLMRVFELCDAAQKAELVRELLPKLAALSMDAFANYMVQCAIEHSDRTTAAQYVVAHFTGNILQMSCNKHSSNVLEVVLRCCGEVPAVRRLFLDELVFNPAALKEVVGDLYGNFVVQALIGVVTNPMEFKRVEDRLRPALVGCQFAAKIEGKIKAKRPVPPHAGGAVHHHPYPQSHQQQEEPRTVLCRAYQDAELREAYDKACASARASTASTGETSTSAAAKHFRHFPYEPPRFITVPFNSVGKSAGGVLYGHPSAARRYMQQQLQRQPLSK
ncbi:putative pumilio protein 9 [Leishmania infantum JPCM5]|uniref:Pumilio_protein_9_-_putative n=2 Tax=Leishmania infantum TaxID=5671 RepID=A0A6L0XH85_LEIIN|nr:putative pumilio protein 9 [Leishmania infantum JPCM5]CAC9484725.1 pumilio_protein_9_-_putative [Leishmania infantum]CAM67520.1 putative pumilio protein 9 [Leishmania infantum JPCM5]SUZ41418.1 pumilio_protein_9_-_putative [Leishmania infantum]|eukprot:XP_001465271.1 putative pumilio protein 9 [Leishmania infantum JPCM5]